MSVIAILIGNSKYDNLEDLDCCEKDLLAMSELLTATEKYSDIVTLKNLKASDLKIKILEAVERNQDIQELLFYFTGHGDRQDQDFFYCAKDYKVKEPNVSGLSEKDLDAILRTANSNTVVKVIDACHSGARLIKSSANIFPPPNKNAFNNFFRIASCHDNQYSSAGTPLSLFTKYFVEAALHQPEGKILYSYIISRLSDTFENHESQIPFFNTQGDYRTIFCDDAKLLNGVRDKFGKPNNAKDQVPEGSVSVVQPREILTDVERLKDLEKSYANDAKAKAFINDFGEAIVTAIQKNTSYQDCFDVQIHKYNEYVESPTKIFIVGVLAKQNRPDKLVEATVTRTKKRNRFATSLMLVSTAFGYDEGYENNFDLNLNCELENIQIKVTLTPKFKSLKQIILIVSFAPSLPVCYVFEHWSHHALTSWEGYEDYGTERNKRWYKFAWEEDFKGVVNKIVEFLESNVQAHIKSVLAED